MNVALGRPDGHAHADLARPLGHRNQHDVHDSDSAYEQRNRSYAPQQKRENEGRCATVAAISSGLRIVKSLSCSVGGGGAGEAEK